MSDDPKRRPILYWAAFLVFFLLLLFGGKQALIHPETPVSTAWNPMVPLRIDDPVTLITSWKLTQATKDPALCLSVLSGGAGEFNPEPDKTANDKCHIRNRVKLSKIGSAQISSVETRCPIALRLAMWEHHGLQPAAQEHLGASITKIHHIGSYNCREIRTPAGSTGRMSSHATADAIDIEGVTLSDGRRLRLISDWGGPEAVSDFMKEAHKSSCAWFRTSLGPEFNVLHADHFHLQNTGWGTCR